MDLKITHAHTGADLEFVCFNLFVFTQNTMYPYEMYRFIRFQNDCDTGTQQLNKVAVSIEWKC